MAVPTRVCASLSKDDKALPQGDLNKEEKEASAEPADEAKLQ